MTTDDLTTEETVPVLVVSFPDELSEREALIMCNRNRPKTREQQLKEYQELKDVEDKRAADRMLAGKSTDPSKNFSQGQEEVGKAADIAAKKIGLSGKTAEKGAEIL